MGKRVFRFSLSDPLNPASLYQRKTRSKRKPIRERGCFRFPSQLRLPPDKVPLVLSFQGKNRKRERRFGFLCPACPGFSFQRKTRSKRKPIRERGFSVFPLLRLPPDKVPLVLSFQGENRKRERLFRFPLPRLSRFFFPAENAGQKKVNPGARFFPFSLCSAFRQIKFLWFFPFKERTEREKGVSVSYAQPVPASLYQREEQAKESQSGSKVVSVFPLCSACRQIKFLWFFPSKERTEKRREKAPYSAARCHVSHTQATQHCAHFGFLASQTCLPW